MESPFATKRFLIEQRTIKARFWDFGGQEIMHATHQFFLSHRALYVLVLDGRKEEDSEYWLNFIKSFGGDSPVLVVMNKIDDNSTFELDRRFLKQKYPNIVEFYKTSCATNEGVDGFFKALKEAMGSVAFIQNILPKRWLELKEHIEQLPQSFMTKPQFRGVCADFGIQSAKTQEVLSDYFDALGIAIHFGDLDLDDIHALNPEWVTNGVYSIINAPKLTEHQGLFNRHWLREILDEVAYPFYTQGYLIALMKQFELCYEIDSDSLLIPSALPKVSGVFEFDESEALGFEFDYNFLPKSIMPQFIVKAHHYIKEDLRWLTGVVLEDRTLKATAFVQADIREKRISIKVNGAQKRDFFAILRGYFNTIHQGFKDIGVVEMVPLPNYRNYRIGYKGLIGYERARRDEYFHGELGKSFSVSKLLNGIEAPQDRQSSIYHVNGDYINTGDKKMSNEIKIKNNSGIASIGDKNTITQNNVNSDVQKYLQSIEEEAQKILAQLPSQKQNEFKEDIETFKEKVQAKKEDKYLTFSKEGILEASQSVLGAGSKMIELIGKVGDFL